LTRGSPILLHKVPVFGQAAALYLGDSCYTINASSIRYLKLWMLDIASGKTDCWEAWFPVMVCRDGFRYECLVHLILDKDNSTKQALRLACTLDTKPITNGMTFLSIDREHQYVEIFTEKEKKKKSFPALSKNEWECIHLSEAGMTTMEICHILCWSESKTKHTKVGIYKKLGVKDMVQAVTVLRMLNLREIFPK